VVRVPQNTSRAFSPLWRFAPPHFASPAKPAVSLIRAGKASVTLNVMP